METTKEIQKFNVDMFSPIKEKFLKLTTEETFNKECSFAIQHLQKNTYLQKSTNISLLQSVLNIIQIGLTLNPVSKLAYLVPRYTNGAVQCCLEPSYMGLVKLATDTGSVVNVYAELIYSNDTFIVERGTNPNIEHKIKFGDRGELIGVYAVAILHDGSKQFEVMEKIEVLEIRDRSESYKSFTSGKVSSCIWVQDETEMWRKTVIKRLCKYLPKTEMWDKLYHAIEVDNEDYKLEHYQITQIETLLHGASIPEERKEAIERNLLTMTKTDAWDLIDELNEKQVNRIEGGMGYSLTDVNNQVKGKLADERA